MKYITSGAQNLIERDNLGIPIAVYKPNTIGNIIVSLIFIVFGIVIAWASASLASIPLILPDISLLHVLSTSSSFSTDAPTRAIFTLFGIFFLLFGLLLVVLCLLGGLSTILNLHVRTVICTNGVACVMRKSADTFRWEQVLTTSNKAAISTSARDNQHGDTNSSTTVRHTYTVYCHDGRRFVFDSTVGKVEELAAEIEVRMARWRAAVN